MKSMITHVVLRKDVVKTDWRIAVLPKEKNNGWSLVSGTDAQEPAKCRQADLECSTRVSSTARLARVGGG